MPYPEADIYKEMSFISYYYNWGFETVMTLDHKMRRQFCAEISAIHREVSNEPRNIFEV